MKPKKSNTLTISVITPTFNSHKTIAKCLSSIRNQNYPQDEIEIIIVDGGSLDDTKKITEKYNVKWIDADPRKQSTEYNKSVGIKKAKGELLLMLDHDNILQNKNLLSSMVEPFIQYKDMVGVETMRYHYNSKDTLLDRYFALFGVTDPLAFYLGKADRMSYIRDTYDEKYNPLDCGKYYLVHFEPNNIPTIGANGFMVKRKTLLDNANMKDGNYFHIDVNVDLIRRGFNTYAFIKDSVTHIAGHGSVTYYLKRRMGFVKQFYFGDKNSKSVRRYTLYEKKDFWKLVFFILISVTFVIPIIDSIRGYVKIRDWAWFVHPVLCFGFVVIYGYVILEHQYKKIAG